MEYMFDRYIGPYEILERIGPVAYRVALPPNLADVHNVFRVSLLRKCISNPNTVINVNQLEVQPNLMIADVITQISTCLKCNNKLRKVKMKSP